jgi:hypothetical protein
VIQQLINEAKTYFQHKAKVRYATMAEETGEETKPVRLALHIWRLVPG